MKLLDLFCGAGGCAVGYYRAGFTDIIGVDIKPQPRYPFRFIQANALEYIAEHGHKFDIVHASPPCQAYTSMRSLLNTEQRAKHSNLIASTRSAVQRTGKPYIIENVYGALRHLHNPVMLCGAMFGLKVYRHRLFECSPWLMSPPHFPHSDRTPKANCSSKIAETVSPKGFISVVGNIGSREKFLYSLDAMGIDWMNRAELVQAIPPAYTEWLGLQMIEVLTRTDRNASAEIA